MVNICRFELIYGFIISMANGNFGMCMTMSSPLLPFFRDHWGISSIQLTFFNAIVYLMAIFGPYIAEFMLRFMGRRAIFCILQSCSAAFVAIMIAGGANRFWLMILMRALLGLSLGGTSAAAPTMLVEVAPAGMSGIFGNFAQIGGVIGQIIMYLQGNWTVNPKYDKYVWWGLLITCSCYDVLSALLVWLTPETYARNEEKENDSNDAEASTEQAKESICQRQYLGKLAVGIALMFIQQFCGINAILTNLDQNFRDAGVPLDSGISATIVVLLSLISAFLGGPVIEKLGRKAVFAISCAGCGTSLFIFALNFKYKWNDWIPLICIAFYMFFFGAALGPVPWYIIPELFPQHLRSLGNSIICTSNCVLTFIVLFLYPVMTGEKDANGNYKGGIGFWQTSIIFAVVSWLGAIFAFFFITEPKRTETLDNSAD